MPRSALLLGACLAIFGWSADTWAGSASSDASISVSIAQGAGIQVVTPLVMPTIVANSGSAQFAGNAPSLGLISADIAGNVKLTVGAQADAMISANQPANYTILRNDGTPAVASSLVNDNGVIRDGPSYQLVGEGAQLGGSIIRGDALSVDVGGRIWLASADTAVRDSNLLVVVVQYN